MSKPGWLQLNDYSNKYKVSISTLRRRIKANEVEHYFEGGKYWLKDAVIEKYVRNRPASAPSQPTSASTPSQETLAQAVTKAMENAAPEVIRNLSAPEQAFADSETKNLAFVETTHELLAELKGAYVLILQEKEEQILQLKEEVADLKTLVKILESENEKYKARETRALEMGWSIEEG